MLFSLSPILRLQVLSKEEQVNQQAQQLVERDKHLGAKQQLVMRQEQGLRAQEEAMQRQRAALQSDQELISQQVKDYMRVDEMALTTCFSSELPLGCVGCSRAMAGPVAGRRTR
jgi:hypothetical protein